MFSSGFSGGGVTPSRFDFFADYFFFM